MSPVKSSSIASSDSQASSQVGACDCDDCDDDCDDDDDDDDGDDDACGDNNDDDTDDNDDYHPRQC